MTQFLLAVLVAGSTQLQTLGPFNDLATCENIATQMKAPPALVKTHKCIQLPAPAAKQQ